MDCFTRDMVALLSSETPVNIYQFHGATFQMTIFHFVK
jgi:hypothetical protein